jgi:L-ascorbate metabolism protein UlaG (beta-lactamase superfamily)
MSCARLFCPEGHDGHDALRIFHLRGLRDLRGTCVAAAGFLTLVSIGLHAADTFPAKGGDIVITPFVHSSVQLEHAGKVIQIDPWSAADLSRAKMADLILITDDPVHHLDVKAIARLRTPGAPVVIPANGQKRLPDGIVMANGDRREVAGVMVEATPAYDLTPGEPYHPKGEANGYIVTLGGVRVYVVGVAECVPEIRNTKDIGVAFFPLNLPLKRMEPEAAIDCIAAFAPKVVYPYHYDQEWTTRATRGEARGTATTRGLEQLKATLASRRIEVRLADWYPR